LATALVRAGVVVVSGGALGIDAAAHQAALDAGGRTWAVAGTGCEHCFPSEHATLFDAIGRGPGAMIWPFPPARAARAGGFVLRNRVLVALSDAVVVVQAGYPSGALRAAHCARTLQKPLWVVPASPWATGFEGSRLLLGDGVRPLTSVDAFLQTLDLSEDPASAPPDSAGTKRLVARPMDPIESAVLRAISKAPLHLDEIALEAHVAIQAAAAALLTLALEAVVVEGPPGFFRRRDSHKLPKLLR
jgi:DNA processing protein